MNDRDPMHNKYTRNPDKLRAWKSAIHVERAPERKKPESGTTDAGSSGKKP